MCQVAHWLLQVCLCLLVTEALSIVLFTLTVYCCFTAGLCWAADTPSSAPGTLSDTAHYYLRTAEPLLLLIRVDDLIGVCNDSSDH